MRTLLSEGCATSTRQGDAGKGLPEPALALWDEQAAGCQQRTKQWRFNALIPACRVQSSTQPLLQSSEPSLDEGGEVKTPPPEPASLRSPQRRRYPPGSSPSPPPLLPGPLRPRLSPPAPPAGPAPGSPAGHPRGGGAWLPAATPLPSPWAQPPSSSPPSSLRCRLMGTARAASPPPGPWGAGWGRCGPARLGLEGAGAEAGAGALRGFHRRRPLGAARQRGLGEAEEPPPQVGGEGL